MKHDITLPAEFYALESKRALIFSKDSFPAHFDLTQKMGLIICLNALGFTVSFTQDSSKKKRFANLKNGSVSELSKIIISCDNLNDADRKLLAQHQHLCDKPLAVETAHITDLNDIFAKYFGIFSPAYETELTISTYSPEKLLFLSAGLGADDIVKSLLKKGCDVDSKDALHAFSASEISDESSFSDEDLIKPITDDKQADGFTALHIASQNNHASTIKLLIDKKATVDLDDNNGITPLQIACRNNHFDAAKSLIKGKATIDLTNGFGDSSLHIACNEGHYDIVKLLVEHAADIDLTDLRGETALQIAADSGHAKIADLIVTKKINSSAFSPSYTSSRGASHFSSRLTKQTKPKTSATRTQSVPNFKTLKTTYSPRQDETRQPQSARQQRKISFGSKDISNSVVGRP